MKRRLLILTAASVAIPSCSNLQPDERALLLNVAGRAIDIGFDKLAESKPVKPQK